ncbi:MAG: hypothetical protein ACLTST_04015 [Lachnospiraceae bacterium]
MNEALAVYLNLNLENVVENEKFIRRIDELLLDSWYEVFRYYESVYLCR